MTTRINQSNLVNQRTVGTISTTATTNFQNTKGSVFLSKKNTPTSEVISQPEATSENIQNAIDEILKKYYENKEVKFLSYAYMRPEVQERFSKAYQDNTLEELVQQHIQYGDKLREINKNLDLTLSQKREQRTIARLQYENPNLSSNELQKLLEKELEYFSKLDNINVQMKDGNLSIEDKKKLQIERIKLELEHEDPNFKNLSVEEQTKRIQAKQTLKDGLKAVDKQFDNGEINAFNVSRQKAILFLQYEDPNFDPNANGAKDKIREKQLSFLQHSMSKEDFEELCAKDNKGQIYAISNSVIESQCVMLAKSKGLKWETLSNDEKKALEYELANSICEGKTPEEIIKLGKTGRLYYEAQLYQSIIEQYNKNHSSENPMDMNAFLSSKDRYQLTYDYLKAKVSRGETLSKKEELEFSTLESLVKLYGENQLVNMKLHKDSSIENCLFTNVFGDKAPDGELDDTQKQQLREYINQSLKECKSDEEKIAYLTKLLDSTHDLGEAYSLIEQFKILENVKEISSELLTQAYKEAGITMHAVVADSQGFSADGQVQITKIALNDANFTQQQREAVLNNTMQSESLTDEQKAEIVRNAIDSVGENEEMRKIYEEIANKYNIDYTSIPSKTEKATSANESSNVNASANNNSKDYTHNPIYENYPQISSLNNAQKAQIAIQEFVMGTPAITIHTLEDAKKEYFNGGNFNEIFKNCSATVKKDLITDICKNSPANIPALINNFGAMTVYTYVADDAAAKNTFMRELNTKSASDNEARAVLKIIKTEEQNKGFSLNKI